MSEKIRSKDLSYEKSLPPFLQRLHAQNAGRPNADRHEQPVPRARRPKDPDDNDDPTVVDEHGETVTKEQLVELNGATQHGAATSDNNLPKSSGVPALIDQTRGLSSEQDTAQTNTVVARKKRKIAKVVGEDSAAEEPAVKQKKAALKPKKPKPIKLTFDDND